jgi:hypothetical protein
MATSVNYDMDQGSDFSFVFTVKNDDGTAKNIQFDYSINAQMRKHYTSSTAVNFSTAKIDAGIGGKVKVSLTASQTADIKPGVYFYDVELLGSSSHPDLEVRNTTKRVQQGMITVYPEITKY